MGIEITSKTKGFFGDMINTVVDATKKGVSGAGREISEIQRSNIDTWGVTSEDGKWRKVPVSWLQVRQNWPDGSKDENLNYAKNHIPLKDTNALYNSIDEVMEDQGDKITVYSGAGVSYAKDHIEGKAGADGPKELTKRDFAYVTKEDFDGRIMDKVYTEYEKKGFKVEGK